MSNSLEKSRTPSYRLPEAGDEFIHGNPQLATRQVMYDALVLDARLGQSLATVRSLGSRGLRVAALGTSAGLPTFSSRWCQRAFVCPADEGSEAYLSYLEQLLDQNSVGVLITSSDATIALIRQHRERLGQRVRIALAREPALGIAINKERTLEVARRLGLNIPSSVSVRTVSQVEAAVREIGLPAVVKPAESWSSNGQQGARVISQFVTTLEEARRAVEELTRFGGTVLLQQFLSGRRESISFLYTQGQIYARCAQWHMRIVGGQSSLRKSIAVPAGIGDQAERLVREIALEGCSEVEFRYDNAGNPYLMEVNPRLWAATELAVRAGVDFPYLLYQWANEEKVDVVTSYRVGGQLRHLSRDVGTVILAARQRGRPEAIPLVKAIRDFCVSFFIPTDYDYVDWKDPLPACTAMLDYSRFVLRRLKKYFSKNLLMTK